MELIVYSWTDYLYSLQILSVLGNYTFNLITITFFFTPLVLLFNLKTKFKVLTVFSIFLLILSNNYFGHHKIKQDEQYNTNLNNFKIKIISPKIPIKRFFEDNNESIIINELIELSNPESFYNSIFVSRVH